MSFLVFVGDHPLLCFFTVLVVMNSLVNISANLARRK